MKPETKKTFDVAIKLCLVCSIVVSTSAVALKSTQEVKKEEFRQRSILEAAGLWEDGASVGELYEKTITPVVVDLQTNRPSDRYDLSNKADQKKLELKTMLRVPEMYDELALDVDVAGIKKREVFSIVYEAREDGVLKTLVLPIRGKGLWSTLYGFIALDMTDATGGSEGLKVAGLTYYKHGETPGLGGEVDNDLWKAKWPGKLLFGNEWDVKIEVAKNASGDYQVDALSGATLTSNGVTNMLKFWLGDEGFGPYLASLSGSGTSSPEPAADESVDGGADEPEEKE